MAEVTWNPSDKHADISLSNGNLTVDTSASAAWRNVRATLSKSAGKWYWEVRVDGTGYYTYIATGVGKADESLSELIVNSYYSSSLGAGDIIGVALDLDAGKLWIAVNNTWLNSGDPAAGTNEYKSGLSGSYFPMEGLFDYGDEVTARFSAADQTYSPPSGFSPLESASSSPSFDGKIKIKRDTVNLLDGKAEVGAFAYNTFDAKAAVKNEATALFNGKAEVIGWKADKLDGKADVTGWAADLVDGKVAVANLSSDLFNGKARVCLTPANIFDGKAKLHGIATNILDGKALVEVEGATNYLDGRVAVQGWKADLLDGKVEVRGSFRGDVDLSALNIEALIGACGDTSLLALEIDSLASVGASCLASYKLSKLQALSYTGAKAEELLPRLEVDSQGIEWILANGAVKVPGIKILSNAKIEELAQGVIRLGALRISSNALHGSFVEGLLSLSRLHVLGSSINGAACEGAILLPCLSISTSGYEFITAIGDIDLGLLDIFAKSRSLTDETCWILKYND